MKKVNFLKSWRTAGKTISLYRKLNPILATKSLIFTGAVFFIFLFTHQLFSAEFLITNFDSQQSPGLPIHGKDDKGSVFNVSTAYSDEKTGNYLGIRYNIVEGGVGWWILPLKGFNASRFKHLTFSVKGKSGGEKFDLGLKDTDGKEVKVMIDNYLSPASEWQIVNIPLVDFKDVNLVSFDSLVIGFGDYAGKGEVYIDNIKFTGVSDIESKSEEKKVSKVLVEGFERTNPYNMYSVISGDDSDLKFTSSRIVREGDYSLEMEYKLLTENPWGTFVKAVSKPLEKPLNWIGAKAVNLWVYGDGSENIFVFNIIDVDDETYSYENANVLNPTKWTNVSMPIEKFYLSRRSPTGNGILDIDKVKSFEIMVKNKSGKETSGEKTTYSKIYIDQLYLTGVDISPTLAAIPGAVERLRAVVSGIGNVDFSGFLWNEYFSAPETSRDIFHWARLVSNAKVDRFSVKMELTAMSQSFGDAVYYIPSSSPTQSGVKNMSVEATALQLLATDPIPNVSVLALGNIWVDYSPYIFSPIWGYKGLTAEGDWNTLNYHLFYIKGSYNSYTLGTRMRSFIQKWYLTYYLVYAKDTAKVDTSEMSSSGGLTNSLKIATEPIQEDLSYLIELRRRLLGEKLNFIFTYGNNTYTEYSEADYTDPYHPLFKTKLDQEQKLSDDIYKIRAELFGLPVIGLNSSLEYRDVGTEFKPKYRQTPYGFDTDFADQYGYNIRVSQWYKGLVPTIEYDDIKRKSFTDGYRRKLNLGVGYYGYYGVDLGYNHLIRKEYNKTRNLRLNQNIDINEKSLLDELYLRVQLRPNLASWFRIQNEDIRWLLWNEDFNKNTFRWKLEYYLSTNARLFVEYFTTRFPDKSWEPVGWPYDDNFLRAWFELSF